MDELAYFLWTAVDHYPQLDVEGHPIKMTSVGQDSMYHKKCLRQIARFVNWWEGTQKKTTCCIELKESNSIEGKLI